jgi:hypothetical protein
LNTDTRPTKITTHLYEPIFQDFTAQLKSLPLKRDAFIELMVERELPRLKEDLAGKVNSAAAKRYIAGSLKRMGGANVGVLRPLSISFRKSTAEGLRELEQAHNFPRDAFFNRLIAFLRSTDYLLKELALPAMVQQAGGGSEDMPTSPMAALEATFFDPLYYLRNACQERYRCGLYTLGLRWPGLACHLPDVEVPGTEEYIEQQAAWNLAFGDDSKPVDAPTKPPKKKAGQS